MSFQAYLDNIETQTGKKPADFEKDWQLMAIYAWFKGKRD